MCAAVKRKVLTLGRTATSLLAPTPTTSAMVQERSLMEKTKTRMMETGSMEKRKVEVCTDTSIRWKRTMVVSKTIYSKTRKENSPGKRKATHTKGVSRMDIRTVKESTPGRMAILKRETGPTVKSYGSEQAYHHQINMKRTR